MYWIGYIVLLITLLIVFLKHPVKTLAATLVFLPNLCKPHIEIKGGAAFVLEPLKINPRVKKFYKTFADDLIKRGWYKNAEPRPAKLIYKDSYVWRPFIDTKIVLNKFGIKESLAFMNKQKLYESVPKKIRDLYFMEQIQIDSADLRQYENLFDAKWILKPILGYKGMGITVVNDYNSFEKKMTSTKDVYIMARYIENPLLIEGKNSVTRFFITLLREKDKLRVFLLPYGILRLAKKKYKMTKKYEANRDNLHLKNTDTKVFSDFIDTKLNKKIRKSLQNQLKKFISLMRNVFTLKCYENDEKCYELLAIDAIITDDLKIKILEINTRPGFFDLSMSDILAGWIYDMAENTKKYTSCYEEIK